MRQIKLDLEKNLAIVDLNAFFYPVHVLQQAEAEFRSIAKISIKNSGNRAIVTIFPKGEEKPGETALHFCNFALALKRELGQHA